MGKYNTPKARSNRRRQLERLGYDEDRILDALDFGFDLEMGTYPGAPLAGKRYESGGVVKAKSKRRGTFKGIF